MKKYLLPLVLFFQMVLLYTEVPEWVIVVNLLFLGLSFFTWLKNLRYLKSITGVMSVIIVLVALRQFNFILSNELIASLLIMLTSIRLIEHRYDSTQPPYFLYLLGLFLAVVKFVFQIDFIFGVYAFIATVFYLYQFFPVAFQLHYRKESYRVLRRIIFYSLPAAIILFLVFPQFKFDGGRQRNFGLFSTIGASGFSAELRPGAISELVNNENIAFRAEFEDFAATQDKLYWRGQVLDRQQGLTWRRSNPLNRASEKLDQETVVYQPKYKVVLEPHLKEQIFTLYETTAVESPERLLLSEKNDTYALYSSLTERLVYQGSVLFNQKQKLAGERSEYVFLHRRSAKVEELLKSLLPINGVGASAEDKVNLLAKYFSEQGFAYRLSGEELAVNSIEDFLFKTKVGFCEHYASAAALLLRYMNVPSRVVVGYQGGEFNKAGNFWTVKQLDAHAWVEYLNAKDEWVLFDPVKFIAPDRISIGATTFINSSGRGQLLKKLGQQFEFVDQLANFLEVSNYRWTLFFVEYSSANLKQQIISFYEANEDVQIVSRLILLLICIYIFYYFTKKFIIRDHSLSERYYSELHRFFSKKLPQQKNESFADWQYRLMQKYPESMPVIIEIFNLYLKNRYGVSSSAAEFKHFKSLLSEKKFTE